MPGGIFADFWGPDTLVAFGGCPIVNDFDVIEPQMTSVLEATYDGTGLPNDGAIISRWLPMMEKALGSGLEVTIEGIGLEGCPVDIRRFCKLNGYQS